jgi:hypothetical protein
MLDVVGTGVIRLDVRQAARRIGVIATGAWVGQALVTR